MYNRKTIRNGFETKIRRYDRPFSMIWQYLDNNESKSEYWSCDLFHFILYKNIWKVFWLRVNRFAPLKHLGTFSKFPQIYTKLTGFEDNGSRKLPFKYYLLNWCSFWEISETSHKIIFVSACKNPLTSYDIIP